MNAPTPWRAATLLALLTGLLGGVGCASPPAQGLHPEFFPRAASAPEPRTPGRVALLVPSQVAGTMGSTETTLRSGPNERVPIGRIVEQAGLDMLGAALTGGVDSLAQAPGAGYDATVTVDAVRCVDRTRLLWLLPFPVFGVIGDTRTDVQVTIELRVLDAQGRAVLTRAYDSGPEELKRAGGEADTAGVVRLAHELTWRLWRNAWSDLREWLAAERSRPREL